MPDAQLHISKTRGGQTLPPDAVTRTFGIFGQKDSGKTTTARVFAEEMVKAGGHVVAVDPVGVWWGITRDGKGKGIPGVVIGGEHADVPLEETGGQLVAELVVARHYPAVVVDTKLLRKGARIRFLADFLESVYHANRRPIHLFFEEADQALPQNPRFKSPELGRVLGAAEDIVKLGRSRGLGSTVISQRFATVTANVREQVEALVLHGLVGPLDRKELRKWIEDYGSAEDVAKVLKSVLELPQGEAWLYSPRWLRLLEHVKVRAAQTLDTSSTPSDDEREAEETAPRAPADLDELRERMADSVERVKSRDPRHLNERIKQLELELQEAQLELRERETQKVAVPDAELVEELGGVAEQLAAGIQGSEDTLNEATELVREVGGQVDALRKTAALIDDQLAVLRGEAPRPRAEEAPEQPAGGPGRATPSGVADARGTPTPPRPAPPPPGPGADAIPRGAMELLQAAAARHPLRLTKAQLCTLAGRSSKSSTSDQQLALLVKNALLDRGDGRYGVTDVGLATAGVTITSNGDPAEVWRSALPEGPRVFLDVLLRARRPMSKAEIAEHAGVSATSSTTDQKLGLLKSNGLVTSRQGVYELTDLVA